MRRSLSVVALWAAMAAGAPWTAVVPRAQAASSAPSSDLGSPEGPSPVDFPTLWALAERASPRLAVARARLGAAIAAVASAAPALPEDPAIELSLGPRASSLGAALHGSAAILQPLFLGGERGARRRAARSAVVAAEAAVGAERWALHAELHARYDGALIAAERVRLWGEVEASAQALVRVAARRAGAGEGARLEVALAEVALAEAREGRLAAEEALAALRAGLGQLAGWRGARAPEPVGEAGLPEVPVLEAVLVAARRDEPELAAAEARVAAARAALEAARREGSWRPAFGVGVEHEAGIGAEPAVWSAEVRVVLPLGAAARTAAPLAEAAGALAIAEAEREARAAEVEGGVAQDHRALVAAVARARRHGEEVVPRLAGLLALVERAYGLGELGLSEALAARERFVQAELGALAAREAALGARAALERWVGAELEGLGREARPLGEGEARPSGGGEAEGPEEGP